MSKIKTKTCTAKASKRVYGEEHLWTAEANVDSVVQSTKPTLKVLREEVIGGKVYKVLSI